MTETKDIYDLAIVGGGVNGCGIARDAAGRGLKVLLLEQGDLAQATSSASTKLFHGGLRYLEHYEFRLVREALIERERLLRAMPHISWPMRFVLPHHDGLRPAWLLRLGLFIYDHLGGRKLLPGTKTLRLRSSPVGAPLKKRFLKAFEYSDCWVDDARLVMLNARAAAAAGADIFTRTRCLRAARQDGLWLVEAEGDDGGLAFQAKALINAGGPWVEQLIEKSFDQTPPARVRLVRGSHIVTPKLFDHDRAYIFQNADDRIVFAIPYQQDFTLIGTTDVDHEGPASDAKCSDEEAAYLAAAASEYFAKPISTDDIVWTFSGVRPLYDDGAESAASATRDYVLHLDGGDDAAPLLSIFGGKITTYRRLAEAALGKLAPFFPDMGKAWTAAEPLPGGDFPVDGVQALLNDVNRTYPFLGSDWTRRLVRAYGSETKSLLGDARSADDLGRSFGHGLTEAEVRWMMEKEWARTADDVLWRRSKLGLRFSDEDAAALADWMRGQNRTGDTARRAAQ